MLRRIVYVVMTLMLVMAVVGCSKPKAEGPRELVIGTLQEPDRLSPLFLQMVSAAQVVRGPVALYLFQMDDKGGFEPTLLKETPSEENGGIKLLPGGKMEVSYRLREGLKWSDGKEITAEDYVFTHKLIMDLALPVPSRTLHSDMETVEATDKYTIKVVYRAVQPFPCHWWHLILPKHYYEPIYEEYKNSGAPDYGVKFAADKRVNVGYVTNGPYIVKEWTPGDKVVLERNPNYNVSATPKIGTVIFKILPDAGALKANILAGTVHMAAEAGLPLTMIIEGESKGEFSNRTVMYTPTFSFYHLQMVLDKPPLNDATVRRALLTAIDREAIAKQLFGGKLKVADTWYPPGHYAYTEDVAKYPYDLEKAKKLLSDAGWKTGKDGKLYKGDTPLSIKLIAVSGDLLYEQLEQLIAGYWSDVGVQVTIENEPAKAFFGETFKKVDEPGAVLLWSWSLDYENLGKQWLTEEIPTAENNWVGQNFCNWSNPENDRLLEMAKAELDQGKRAEVLAQQQLLWTTELPDLPLLYRVKVTIVPKNLSGVSPAPFGYIGWNIAQWAWQTQ
ncbi:MAG TPA: peptide ABC transporter substrate-binding protein [Firmicutes bacterium]|nr:peptide ABC transporter substrate-binding protein [Bacillota bacterium]